METRIFFSIWQLAYVCIVICSMGVLFFYCKHNKAPPIPDIYQIQNIDDNPVIMHSPSNAINYNSSESSKIIHRLINDKNALTKQLQNVSEQLISSQQQLQALRSTGNPSINPKLPNYESFSENTKNEDRKLDQQSLEEENRRLKQENRTIQTTIKNLKSEINTHQKSLEEKTRECDSQKHMLVNREQTLTNLKAEKEGLENELTQKSETKDDMQILLQVKEEEINIAKNENERLHAQLIQLQQTFEQQLKRK